MVLFFLVIIEIAGNRRSDQSRMLANKKMFVFVRCNFHLRYVFLFHYIYIYINLKKKLIIFLQFEIFFKTGKIINIIKIIIRNGITISHDFEMFKLSFSFEHDDEEDDEGDGIHGYMIRLCSVPVADRLDF